MRGDSGHGKGFKRCPVEVGRRIRSGYCGDELQKGKALPRLKV